jgi:hypothetical protein
MIVSAGRRLQTSMDEDIGEASMSRLRLCRKREPAAGVSEPVTEVDSFLSGFSRTADQARAPLHTWNKIFTRLSFGHGERLQELPQP